MPTQIGSSPRPASRHASPPTRPTRGQPKTRTAPAPHCDAARPALPFWKDLELRFSNSRRQRMSKQARYLQPQLQTAGASSADGHYALLWAPTRGGQGPTRVRARVCARACGPRGSTYPPKAQGGRAMTGGKPPTESNPFCRYDALALFGPINRWRSCCKHCDADDAAHTSRTLSRYS